MTAGSGSSPRGRGTRRAGHGLAQESRFIPARAGNTCDRWPAGPSAPVHPRAGGEHSAVTDRATRRSGSSPRGRGTPRHLDADRAVHRFIPARAGNTAARTSAHLSPPVHPRAGGEHPLPCGPRRSAAGSSPRGRGTQINRLGDTSFPRFIPARAGNTIRQVARSLLRTVHPRAGGEHQPSATRYAPQVGSSPRGRGTPVRRGSRCGRGRFIPARAGNTRRPWSVSPSRPVHPRAGGEHDGPLVEAIEAYGSSPRGRGTPRDARSRDWRGRFIPARAGNTGTRQSWSGSASVHPRAGGEHAAFASESDAGAGSSPRGRGTPIVGQRVPNLHRFIPARAGNTGRGPRVGAAPPVHPRAGGEHTGSGTRRDAGSGSSPRGRGTQEVRR